MILIGISVSPEVLRTKNIIIGLLAVSLFGFNCCSSSIAFSPIGVAALSSPSIFAERFIKIAPVAGWPLGMSGKNLQNTGLSQRERVAISPPFSPIFIIPNQRERIPVSPRDISNAVLEELNVEFIISVNTCVSPKKISLASAMTKAITKNVIQM